MAAFDCLLELDPASAPASPAAMELGSPSAASAGTAVLFPLDLHLKSHAKQQRQGQDEQQATASPCSRQSASSAGCSWSGGAGLGGAALLDLEDDACSRPTPQRCHQQPGQPGQRQHAAQLLPDGTPLVAATFWDDLLARGSVFQHCTRRQ